MEERMNFRGAFFGAWICLAHKTRLAYANTNTPDSKMRCAPESGVENCVPDSLLGRCYAYPGADFFLAGVLFIAYHAVHKGEKCPVPAHTNVFTGMNPGSQLAYKDVSGENGFSAEFFHTASLTRAVATISRATARFFMSHCISPLSA